MLSPLRDKESAPVPAGTGAAKSLLALRSDQLDDGHLGDVAAAGADLDDAGVAAVAVSILGAVLVDDLLGHGLLGDVGLDLTLGVQLFLLPQGHHLLGHGTNFLKVNL